MIYILTCLIFYGSLFFLDLLPLLRQKERRPYLRFALPVFAATLACNILIGLRAPSVSITTLLIALLSKIQK